MLKKFLIFLFFSLLLPIIIYSQGLSPLVPYVSTNQLIDRPEVFRTFQTKLSDNIASTKPGLQLNFIYSQLSDLRKKYIDEIKAPEVKLSESKLNLEIEPGFLKKLGITKKIDIPIDITAGQSFESLTETLQSNLNIKFNDYLATYLNSAFSQTFKSEIFKKPMLFTLNKLLENSDYYKNLTPDDIIIFLNEYNKTKVDKDDKLFNKISNTITNNLTAGLIKGISEKMESDFTQTIKLTTDEEIEKFKDKYINYLNEYLNKQMSTAIGVLNNTLNAAEVQVRSLVETASKSLISGNVGMALSEGEGDFAGGLQYTYKANEDFLFGFYLNGELSSADTTEAPKSLIGGQFKYAPFEKLEIAGLLSFYFGAANYKAMQANEFGGGISYTTGSLIIGASYFYLNQNGTTKNVSYPNNHTYGVFVRGNSSDSPIMFLGGSTQTNQKANFGFQIIYPINSK